MPKGIYNHFHLVGQNHHQWKGGLPYCLICKAKLTYYRSPSAIKRGVKQRCRNCYIKEKQEKAPDTYIIVECYKCGISFKKRKDKISDRNFCSKKCVYDYRRGRHLSSKIIINIKKGMAKKEIVAKMKILNSRKRKPQSEEHKKAILFSRGKWTDEQKAKVSQKLCGKMPANTFNSTGKYKNIKSGYYNINGKEYFFRSRWEANYSLYLDYLKNNNQIKEWEYEKDVFVFEAIKFGTRSYRPDFKIYNSDGSFEYHEVKGYMDAKSKTKLNRMRIYHPNIKLILIDKKAYKEIEKWGKLLKFY